MKIRVPEHIQSLPPYVAGKRLEEVEREYGIQNSIKLASNENPLGPSPLAVAAVGGAVATVHRYPDSSGYELTRALAARYNLAPSNIVLGNGSDDIINMIASAFLQPGDEVIIPQPSFLFYEITVRSAGALPQWVALKSFAIDLEQLRHRITDKTRLIFLNNPHNPTGAVIARDEFEAFIDFLPPEVAIVLDEAYIEFVREPRCPQSFYYLDSGKALIGLRTFSKAYGLAGLRVGYGLMPADLAQILNRVRQPFNVNLLAQVAATAALRDEDFLNRTIALVHQGLDLMYQSLDQMGVVYLPSQANFLLINVGAEAAKIFDRLLRRGIIVRLMDAYGYPDCIRVNIGLPEENMRFLEALREILA